MSPVSFPLKDLLDAENVRGFLRRMLGSSHGQDYLYIVCYAPMNKIPTKEEIRISAPLVYIGTSKRGDTSRIESMVSCSKNGSSKHELGRTIKLKLIHKHELLHMTIFPIQDNLLGIEQDLQEWHDQYHGCIHVVRRQINEHLLFLGLHASTGIKKIKNGEPLSPQEIEAFEFAALEVFKNLTKIQTGDSSQPDKTETDDEIQEERPVYVPKNLPEDITEECLKSPNVFIQQCRARVRHALIDYVKEHGVYPERKILIRLAGYTGPLHDSGQYKINPECNKIINGMENNVPRDLEINKPERENDQNKTVSLIDFL